MEDLPVSFATEPGRYRHWRIEVDPPIATLLLDVDPGAGLGEGYDLKLNSYDLGVDIELADAMQRLRFEHPEVHAVVLTGGKEEKVFCAGANIGMLAGATHHHKVNFCKFTNETRNAIEDATDHSGQVYLAALNGTASGGGYELALATDEIILVDDRASAVSLPEVPLLGVLPGTGGLTRLVDKRHVRRDRADVFATRAEGVRGEQAVGWGLVDSVVPRSRFDEEVRDRARVRAAESDRPGTGPGIEWRALDRAIDDDAITYPHVGATIDRSLATMVVTITGPEGEQPADPDAVLAVGVDWWPLAVARALDDLLLHVRFNEPELTTIVFRADGDPATVLVADQVLRDHADHWLIREVRLYLARTLSRLDLTSRTIVTLVEPGSCFAGTMSELVLAADRSFMLDGTVEEGERAGYPAGTLTITDANTGWYPMANGLSRLATRFHGRPDELAAAEARCDEALDTSAADELGLVTFTPDDIDWDEEVRLTLEERASFSPDALTGMEANYRFVGPETTQTKIFARLSAWQNWIFQRPNAAGPEGALRRYGTGSRPVYDHTRI